MRELLVKLTFGIDKKDLTRSELVQADMLIKEKLLQDAKHLKFIHGIVAGVVDITRSGLGFLEGIAGAKKDLPISRRDMKNIEDEDIIIARIEQKRGKTFAVPIKTVQKAVPYSVCIVQKERAKLSVYNIKTSQRIYLDVKDKSLKTLPDGAVLKVENTSKKPMEVLGVIEDPFVDEKISLALYDKKDEHPKACIVEAEAWGKVVDKSLYSDRIDLTSLPFITIDPIDAKDFDDAIYFDTATNELYVSIADVSSYVTPLSALDAEARKRGFSIYLPHRSVPMLPRNLSENICSLNELVDRLTFTFKIKIDPESLEVVEYELFEAIINSKRRYHYDEIDIFLDKAEARDETDRQTLNWLRPLDALTRQIREKRLKKGFEFSSDEIRMSLDEKQNIIATRVEEQTRSHALIEDCMLLANKLAAQYFDYGIFRCHDKPSVKKLKDLMDNLDSLGLNIKHTNNIHALIQNIQETVKGNGLEKFVDKLIIKTQQKAVYQATNIGHFGLGFDKYTHFTSPIRRYSDLILHRLLKTIIHKDDKAKAHILKDIEAVAMTVSRLEREAAKVEWDFIDRKFVRWAEQNIGKSFRAIVTDVDDEGFKDTIAKIEDDIKGARVFMDPESEAYLFEEIDAEIIDVNIATTKIYAKAKEWFFI